MVPTRIAYPNGPPSRLWRAVRALGPWLVFAWILAAMALVGCS